MLKDSAIQGAGHHVRAKTQTPIIGVLTQPLPTAGQGHDSMWENQFENYKTQEFNAYDADKLADTDVEKTPADIFPRKQFVENTHVKFLESAGARVIPIDYTKGEEEVQRLLK